jgi:hypothetical protein
VGLAAPLAAIGKRLTGEGVWVHGVDLKFHECSETEADDFVLGDLRDEHCRTVVDRRLVNDRPLQPRPARCSPQHPSSIAGPPPGARKDSRIVAEALATALRCRALPPFAQVY